MDLIDTSENPLGYLAEAANQLGEYANNYANEKKEAVGSSLLTIGVPLELMGLKSVSGPLVQAAITAGKSFVNSGAKDLLASAAEKLQSNLPTMEDVFKTVEGTDEDEVQDPINAAREAEFDADPEDGVVFTDVPAITDNIGAVSSGISDGIESVTANVASGISDAVAGVSDAVSGVAGAVSSISGAVTDLASGVAGAVGGDVAGSLAAVAGTSVLDFLGPIGLFAGLVSSLIIGLRDIGGSHQPAPLAVDTQLGV